MFPAQGIPLHTPLDAIVTSEFACRRRNGTYVIVPPGPCQVEQGEHFAAICWERRNGQNRAQVSLGALRDYFEHGKLALR